MIIHQKVYKLIFPLLIGLMLFSLWAGFALLVVNKLFYQDLPGYTIGQICIWEYVAIVVAVLIANMLIKTWGNIDIKEIEDQRQLIMNPKYGMFFSVYFVIATIVGIWQFWIFSQQF